MSYLERLREKFPGESPKAEPTKPTKPGYVGFVGSLPGPFPKTSVVGVAGNDEGPTGLGLPLETAFAEFERVFARLAALASYPPDFCAEVLRNVRAGMTPSNAREEIDVVRELIAAWESAAQQGRET